MKTFLSLGFILLSFFGSNGFAQVSDPILKYAQTITSNDLKAHLYFLASPELEGRETGEHGQKITARYLASQFEKLGLKPPFIQKGQYSYFQPFTVKEVKFNGAKLNLGSKKKNYSFGNDFYLFNASSISEKLEGELVFCGMGIQASGYDNMNGILVSNKIAVCLMGEPKNGEGIFKISRNTEPSDWGKDMSMKRKLMEEKGAKALIMIADEEQFKNMGNSPMIKRMTGRASTTLVNPAEDPPIPLIIINESLAAELLKYGKMKIPELKKSLNEYALVPTYDFSKFKFSLSPDMKIKTMESENVLGLLEGTDKKDEIVILTAHYDHLGIHDGEIFVGADDDGSGVSAILEIAEAFSDAAKNGIRPRRSILFMPVSGEEKGLLGSSYYADHPVFPLKNTVTDLNIDMIGRIDEKHEKLGDSNYVYIIGADKLSTDLHRVNDSINQAYWKINFDYTFNDPKDPNRFYYRSDHYNFAKNGVPIIFYFTGVHADYHKSTDTPDKIMFGKMTYITRHIFATAWEIANREERLRVDQKNDFPSDR